MRSWTYANMKLFPSPSFLLAVLSDFPFPLTENLSNTRSVGELLYSLLRCFTNNFALEVTVVKWGTFKTTFMSEKIENTNPINCRYGRWYTVFNTIMQRIASSEYCWGAPMKLGSFGGCHFFIASSLIQRERLPRFFRDSLYSGQFRTLYWDIVSSVLCRSSRAYNFFFLFLNKFLSYFKI